MLAYGRLNQQIQTNNYFTFHEQTFSAPCISNGGGQFLLVFDFLPQARDVSFWEKHYVIFKTN